MLWIVGGVWLMLATGLALVDGEWRLALVVLVWGLTLTVGPPRYVFTRQGRGKLLAPSPLSPEEMEPLE